MPRRLLPALACCLLSACADYQFTVNERVIYTPAPLFSGYDIADNALRECVRQHVLDHSVTAAPQLLELNCSHAGVAGLEGLGIFSGLTRLKLSNNAIGDTEPLAALTELIELYLDGNRLRGLAPIQRLRGLGVLDLRGNDALACEELAHFRRLPELKLVPPRHCTD